jgi:SAM-dependent methyltransferase
LRRLAHRDAQTGVLKLLKPICPICKGGAFGVFNSRPRAICETCGSLERGRYQWLVLQKFVSLEPGSVVAHFAPETFFIEHFSQQPGLHYRAYDKYPEFYRNGKVPVAELDLCTDLQKLEAGSVDLIIHSHVLEHLPCTAEPVLENMKSLLKPGGVMLFSVPIHGKFSVEGIDPALTIEETGMRARQGEHMRSFGRIDFPVTLARIFGGDCLIRQKDHFDLRELEQANIPIARSGEPTGKSVFLYRKPDR